MLNLHGLVFASALLICNVYSQESTTKGFFSNLFEKGQKALQDNPALVQQGLSFVQKLGPTTTPPTTLYPNIASILANSANSQGTGNSSPDLYQQILQQAPQLIAAGQNFIKSKSNSNPQQSTATIQEQSAINVPNANQNFPPYQAQQNYPNAPPFQAQQNYPNVPSPQVQQNYPNNPQVPATTQDSIQKLIQGAQTLAKTYQNYQELQKLIPAGVKEKLNN